MNFETQALALGIIQALRARAPQLEDVTQAMPLVVRIEYVWLVRRALAVSAETTWGEINSIYEDYLEMAARNGLAPSAELN